MFKQEAGSQLKNRRRERDKWRKTGFPIPWFKIQASGQPFRFLACWSLKALRKKQCMFLLKCQGLTKGDNCLMHLKQFLSNSGH
jgi:hypothetical protein